MDSGHVDRLKKLCGGLPEDKLVRMKAGLDEFFEKNPMPGKVRSELQRIQGISGGVSDAELTGLVAIVAVGLISWYLVNKYNAIRGLQYDDLETGGFCFDQRDKKKRILLVAYRDIFDIIEGLGFNLVECDYGNTTGIVKTYTNDKLTLFVLIAGSGGGSIDPLRGFRNMLLNVPKETFDEAYITLNQEMRIGMESSVFGIDTFFRMPTHLFLLNAYDYENGIDRLKVYVERIGLSCKYKNVDIFKPLDSIPRSDQYTYKTLLNHIISK